MGNNINILRFLKQFDLWKALAPLTTAVLLGVFESVFYNIYIIWWMVLVSLPLIYLLSCIKTQFEKDIDYLKRAIDWAYSEPNQIKRAAKMSAVAMKNANKCAIKVMYGPESQKSHWKHLANLYETMRKNWREELQILVTQTIK